MLAGCGTSMSAVSVVEKNRVYVIRHGDFLSSSRMILVVDENGKVVASSGGTVQGGGAFATQTAIGIVTAGANGLWLPCTVAGDPGRHGHREGHCVRRRCSCAWNGERDGHDRREAE